MSVGHKKFICLTGPPGIGKTTLVKKVCKVLQQKHCSLTGFFTEEIRQDRQRIGFDIVLLDGRRGPLARIDNGDSAKGPRVGKYSVHVKSFENLALPQFSEENKTTILVLDEIGKMELFSVPFRTEISRCIDSCDRIIFATVPMKTSNSIPLVDAIKSHSFTKLIHVQRENRDFLVDEIVNYLLDAVSNYQ